MKDPIRDKQASRTSLTLNDIGIDDCDLRMEMFTLCDGASEQGGRLSLIGTYEAIHAAGFPCVLPQVTVVLRIRFWPQEGNLHLFRLVLTNPDGKPLGVLVDATATLPPFIEDRSTVFNIIAHLQHVGIEEPGEHTLDFYLDDKMAGRLPVNVCSMVRA